MELCLGSRGQTPLPLNSCFIRKMPSSINSGVEVVVVGLVKLVTVVVVEIFELLVLGPPSVLLGVLKTSLTVV